MSNQDTIEYNKRGLAVYIPDGKSVIVPRFSRGDVWLTQKEIAELFGCSRENITQHLKNALTEELDGLSVCKDFLLTAADGKNYTVKVYNLDAVLSVGYRVHSPRGIQFRIWTNKVIKGHIFGASVMRQIEERTRRELVEAAERGERLTLEELARRIGRSKTSARRYMKHLGGYRVFEGVIYAACVELRDDNGNGNN